VDTFFSSLNRTKTIQTFHERLQEFLRVFIREKKARKKFLKKNETHILPIYIFHSYSRRDNKKKRARIVTLVLWPAKWRVTEMKTQT
jgi:hypothetical protein